MNSFAAIALLPEDERPEAIRQLFVRASFVLTLRQIRALPMTLDCPDVEK